VMMNQANTVKTKKGKREAEIMDKAIDKLVYELPQGLSEEEIKIVEGA
jgi:hypothetical protein